MGRPQMTEKRFWEKVDASAGLNGCWPWMGARNKAGYGVTSFNWVQTFAHRFVYSTKVGPIPFGLNVCHKCDNPPCCNPKHLFVGTFKDNAADMVSKGRQSRGEKHSKAILPGRLRGQANPLSKLTNEQVSEMRTIYATTKTPMREIANRFGISEGCADKIVSGQTWKHLPTPKKEFEGDRKAKLDASLVRELRALKASGWTVTQLIHRFKLSRFTINDVVYRRTWKSI